MPKCISNELKDFIKNSEPSDIYLGIELARQAIKYQFRVTDLADAFGVSRMTMHTWFRGGYMRKSNLKKIICFLRIIDRPTTMSCVLTTQNFRLTFLKMFKDYLETRNLL